MKVGKDNNVGKEQLIFSVIPANAAKKEEFSLLTSTEKAKQNSNNMINTVQIQKPGLVVENLCASWNQLEDNKSSTNSSQQLTLNNVSFSVSGSELVAIVGPVGAGKSSLLMALLGELRLCSGSAEVEGKLGYVSQQSWVFSETLRNNILCGQPFEEDCYQNTLICTALLPDLALLRSADQTLVGERGVVLSGGQRARVSLARAIYQNADVYLLDDPFSAVDARVGRILFHRCIMDALASKPRILVTHNVQFARQADRILVMQDGYITAQGTYDDLVQNGVDFMQLIRDEGNMEKDDFKSLLHGQSTLENDDNKVTKDGGDALQSSSICKFEEEKLDAEECTVGKVSWITYLNYFRAGGHPLYHIFLFCVLCTTQALYFLSDWWLTKWAIDFKKYNVSASVNCFQTNGDLCTSNVTSTSFQFVHYNYFLVYTAVLLGLLVVPILRALLLTNMIIRASKELHNRMFSRLLGAPVLFYDTNPAGRVLNRFSTDIGNLDYILPENLSSYLYGLFVALCNVLVATVTNFWMILPTVPLVVVFKYFCDYFLSTSRAIKRIESTTRSPILSHISNTLLGLATIRSMDQEDQFVHEFSNIVDRHTAANLLNFASEQWFALRLDFLCSIFSTCVAFISVLMSSQLNNALLGLSLVYSINLVDFFQWFVRISGNVEIQMVSTERILEYTRLDQEEVSSSLTILPENWPTTGSIEFHNVSFRYSADQPLVLQQISFKINSMEKIGIVGRTGSGKSSLLAALFRLAEIESDDGYIFIDGVSTRDVSLPTLRRKMSVIPQDPVLFSVTIRLNLDPFGKCDDGEIWRVLEEVQLSKTVTDLNDGLDHMIVEGGLNFSVGQRQLLCLARALLCRNRILIFDEATANVDPHTDSLIQKTLRHQFAQCTVLTIAHRLHTVWDCDRLLVLENGRVVQFDQPNRLLELKSGQFYSLVQSLGLTDVKGGSIKY